MARTQEIIPAELWLTNCLSHGVLAHAFPMDVMRAALSECGRTSTRRRALPAELMMYYVIALGLYRAYPMPEIFRCMAEALRPFGGGPPPVRVPTSQALTIARERLGTAPFEVLRRLRVRPLARPRTRGSWFHGLRLMALDGTTLTVPDDRRNRDAFGLPASARGATAFPQLRLTTLTETGTHAMVAWRYGRYRESERRQAIDLLPALTPDMLVLADRGFGGYALWTQAVATDAGLLWRLRDGLRLPVRGLHEDGSYDSELMPPKATPGQSPAPVRIVEYTLPGRDTIYRLATNLAPALAAAPQLAALYHERWETEGAYDEIKTHLLTPGPGASTALRSRTPELVRQEMEGVLLAHYAARMLAHETAHRHRTDPDRISFSHTVRVIRRHLQNPRSFPP